MKITHVTDYASGFQDGAIFGDLFFSLNTVGECRVYDLSKACEASDGQVESIASFVLDKTDCIIPHCNSVVFGSEYFNDGDEFPVLYANIYNNYANEQNRLEGVCLAYRIARNGDVFTSQLVQIIEIGFVDSSNLWCSENINDIRPYGNFVVDTQTNTYWAFTMRDELNQTRYFSFDLPKLSDGEPDEKYGVNRVVLMIDDIKTYFDCEYHNYIQGATFHDGKIYSVEGFSVESGKIPVLRVIDTETKKQIAYFDFAKEGIDSEPEMISFRDNVCYYGTAHGNLFEITEIF